MQCDPQDQSICLACRSGAYMWEDGICRKNGEAPPIPVEEEEDNNNNGGNGGNNGGNPTNPDGSGGDGESVIIRQLVYWAILIFLF